MRIIFELLLILSENLNPLHQELFELIFVESSNQTLVPEHQTNCLCVWLATRCAHGWQRANLGSVVLK